MINEVRQTRPNN